MKPNMNRHASLTAVDSIRIGTKVYILAAFCMGLLVLVSASSLWRISKIGVEIEEISQRSVPLIRDLTEITIHQLEQAVNFERAFRAGKEMNQQPEIMEEFDKAVRAFEGFTSKIELEFSQIKEITRSSAKGAINEEERLKFKSMLSMLHGLDIEHQSYDQLARKAFKLLAAGKLEYALLLLPRIETEEEDLDLQLENMLREGERFLHGNVNKIDELEQTAVQVLLLLTGFTLVLGTFYALYIVRRNISRPLSEIVSGLGALSAGDMSVEVKVYNNDEIGSVARAYAVFKKTMMKLTENEAELRHSQDELISHRDHLQKRIESATRELAEALAKEKKLNELQCEFVSMASHEFRTPLTIIDGVAQRIKSQAGKNRLTPEDAIERVEKIRGAVRRMTRLMDSTLTAARMQDGKIEIDIHPCDISSLVREVCEHQQEISGNHVISCDLADLPATIQTDSGCVEQMLSNLLSNAVKYAPDAPGIEVRGCMKDDQVVISVRDYGLGIDADELDRVGERFFRAKTSTGTAGTGIGLNLVKTLVEMHGGSIRVESKKGEGSTFTISLPAAGPDLSEQPEQVETKVA